MAPKRRSVQDEDEEGSTKRVHVDSSSAVDRESQGAAKPSSGVEKAVAIKLESERLESISPNGSNSPDQVDSLSVKGEPAERLGSHGAFEKPQLQEKDSERGQGIEATQGSPSAQGPAFEDTDNANLTISDGRTIDIDTIISRLALPDKNIEVVKEFSNSRSTDVQVQAYAKLAGQSWTYYVQRLEIVIGRRAVDGTDHVDIDLGPSKVVSRRHAVIKYNLHTRCWEITVVGRNGIKIDRVSHKHGTAPLRSGTVFDIGGVQMMFVLPDSPPILAPSMLPGPAVTAGATPADEKPPIGEKNTLAPSKPYPRGLAMVSRPQIRGQGAPVPYFEQDLSSDECKDIKPPFSYATMISQAILSTEGASMSLADIYTWIASHYSYYRHSKPGWQNSIRHNLSLNKAFEKVARKENEPGKGSKWQITPKYREEFLKKAQAGKLIKGRGQGNFQASLNPGIPASVDTGIPTMHVTMPPSAEQYSYYIPQGTHSHEPPVFEGSGQLPGGDDLMRGMSPLHRLQELAPSVSATSRAKAAEADADRRFPEFLDAEYNAVSPVRFAIAQPEAYTPERGSSTSRRATGNGTSARMPSSIIAGSSPAFWKYMHFNTTPVKPDKSPLRQRDELGDYGVMNLRFQHMDKWEDCDEGDRLQAVRP